MRDTTTHGLIFTRPLPQGSAAPASGAFWTDEYGWVVPVEPDYEAMHRVLVQKYGSLAVDSGGQDELDLWRAGIGDTDAHT